MKSRGRFAEWTTIIGFVVAGLIAIALLAENAHWIWGLVTAAPAGLGYWLRDEKVGKFLNDTVHSYDWLDDTIFIHHDVNAYEPKTQENQMAVSTLAQIAAEAPDFQKLINDVFAAGIAFSKGDFTTLITNASVWEADAVRVYNDIFAKGVVQATTPPGTPS